MTKRTPELVARAASLRAQGFGWEVVGGSCGVSGATARYWLVEADAARRRAAARARQQRRPRRPRPRAVLLRPVELALTLASYRELERRAEALGVRRSVVARALLEAGLSNFEAQGKLPADTSTEPMTATIAPDRPARTRALPVLLSVRLSTGTYERVEALAARNGVGAALVCRQLIEAALRVEALG